jgi:hypothetical protein
VLRGLGQLAAAEPDLDEDPRAEDDPLQDVNLSRMDEEEKSELVNLLQTEADEEASRRDVTDKMPKTLASALHLACQLLQFCRLGSLQVFLSWVVSQCDISNHSDHAQKSCADSILYFQNIPEPCIL